MATEQDKDTGTAIAESTHLAGKRLYRPGVLAAYCILTNLPLGVFLFSLNVYRRGSIWAGRISMALTALAIVGYSVVLAAGVNLTGSRYLLLNIVVGLGIMKAEQAKYEKAISNGALPARWWPPLIFVCVNMLVIYLLAWLIAP